MLAGEKIQRVSMRGCYHQKKEGLVLCLLVNEEFSGRRGLIGWDWLDPLHEEEVEGPLGHGDGIIGLYLGPCLITHHFGLAWALG